jgi:uncharacterized protein
MEIKSDAFCRIAPFGLYMAFLAVEGILFFLTEKGIFALSERIILSIYPIKIISVAFVILFFRNSFTEIRLRDFLSPIYTLLSIVVGIAIFFLWINMDFHFATIGKPHGFDPSIFAGDIARNTITAARLVGAVFVVPVMEELFWRSFLIRYIISPDFNGVPLGRFTWSSFLITGLFFGLEHNYFLAGIIAGSAYNLLLYKTGSISQCILAHGVTNLFLGIYVITSCQWQLW